jgi:hypothetical protein
MSRRAARAAAGGAEVKPSAEDGTRMSQVDRNGTKSGTGGNGPSSGASGGVGAPGGTLSALGLGANLDTEVGKLVVDMGLATSTEIDFCREQQKQSSDPNQRSLADLLVEHSFITVNQAKRIRSQLDVRKGSSQIPGYAFEREVGRGAMARV